MRDRLRAILDVRTRRPQAIAEVAAHRADGQVRNDLPPDAVIRSIAVASGLGTPGQATLE